jgi:hypothetical protein
MAQRRAGRAIIWWLKTPRTLWDLNKPATVYKIGIGTNDYGGNITLANFRNNIETLINQIKTAAPTGAKILLPKVYSPINSTTNAGGNTKDDFTAQLSAAAAAQGTATHPVWVIDHARTVNKTPSNPDVPDSVHPSVTPGGIAGTGGQNKMANELLPSCCRVRFPEVRRVEL